MGSDRARRTYDQGRQYKRVVAQQGRAIIEADLNDAQEIVTEEMRREAMEVVGPVGTPDNGYALTLPAAPAGEIDVGAGTMYLGGMRVSLASHVLWSSQPEWRDNASAIPSPLPDAEVVLLVIAEHEVSAVEDRTLREVALGGPDTSQRTRLLQRIVRVPITAAGKKSCDLALANMISPPFTGLSPDPSTKELVPSVRLKVHFGGQQAASPCDPVAKVGYLGAENQLIRVQISASNKIVWAKDNASALYRVESIEPDTSTSPHQIAVKLVERPVDASHTPKPTQFAELLRVRMDLGDQSCIAAPTGIIAKILDYDDDQGILTLEGDVDAAYEADGDAGKLFARIWEEETSFTPNQSVPIGDTGLDVTVLGSAFAVGSYWMIALRPGAPDQVFPKRYLDAAGAAPEGPRQWLCPLGIVEWNGSQVGTLLHDCRKKFDNLVQLTARPYGWFTKAVGKVEIAGGSNLQSMIDAIKGSVPPGEKVTVGLQPGIYELTAPLVLGAQHSGLVLEGNGGAAVITTVPGAKAFLHGLVIVDGATDVHLHGLTFAMSTVHFPSTDAPLAGVSVEDLYLSSNGAIDFRQLKTAIGVRVIGGSVVLRDCVFDFSRIQAPSSGEVVFAAGVVLNGQLDHVEISRTTMLGPFDGSDVWSSSFHAFGVIQAPTTYVTALVAPIEGGNIGSTVSDLLIQESRFDGLTAAALFHGARSRLSLRTNVIDRCHSGAWLLPQSVLAATSTEIRDALVPLPSLADGSGVGAVESALQTLRAEPLVAVGGALARAFPLESSTYPLTTTLLQGSLAQGSLQQMLVGVEAELAAASGVTPLSTVIEITGNRFAGPATGEGSVGSRAAFMIWDEGWSSTSGAETSVTFGANWVAGISDFAMTTLVGVRWCAASANTIRNLVTSATAAHSLVIVPPLGGAAPESAIAGNAFSGPTVLPKRATPLGVPAVPWSFFNVEEGATGGGGESGATAPLYFDATLDQPMIAQIQRSGTGTSAGAALRIQGQQGQELTPMVDLPNNDGGDVSIEGGARGGGGSPFTGRQGAARLVSSGYTAEVSSLGVSVELGAPDSTLQATAPTRWTSEGTDFLEVRGINDAGVLLGGILATSAVAIALINTNILFRIAPDEGFKFRGKDVIIDGAPLRHKVTSVVVVSGVAEVDLTKGCLHELTLTENTHIVASSLADGMRLELLVRQSGPGDFTVTWDSAFAFTPTSDADPSPQGITIYDFSVNNDWLRCMNAKKGF